MSSYGGASWWRNFAALLLLTVICTAMVAARYRLYINVSDSMPGWLYLVQLRGPVPSRGALIAFQAPPTPFYPADAVFLKYVAGLPGDQVAIRGRRWHLNQQYLGRIKTHARSGAPLQAGPQGELPAAHYAVWSPEEDSYDSRYQDIGWIAHERVIGRAHRLL